MKRHTSIVLAMAGTIALLVSTPAQASDAAKPVDFSAQAVASGLTIAQADLQERVDEVLAAIPGGRQVSATEVKYDGLNVTGDPLFSETSSRAVNAITCGSGYFCIHLRDKQFVVALRALLN